MAGYTYPRAALALFKPWKYASDDSASNHFFLREIAREQAHIRAGLQLRKMWTGRHYHLLKIKSRLFVTDESDLGRMSCSYHMVIHFNSINLFHSFASLAFGLNSKQQPPHHPRAALRLRLRHDPLAAKTGKRHPTFPHPTP